MRKAAIKTLGAKTLRSGLACAAALWTSAAWSHCDGGYPNVTVQQELRATPLVVIGKVTGLKLVVDPIEDPAGYEGEIFIVDVERVVHGALPLDAKRSHTMSVYNENTSARFPMNIGTRYVLFVSRSFDGPWIDSCGNSVEAAKAGPLLKEIRRRK